MKILLISGTLLSFALFTNNSDPKSKVKSYNPAILIEETGSKINHLNGTHIDPDNNKYVDYINMLDGHRGISISDTLHKSHLTQSFEWIKFIKLSDGNYALVWQKIGGHYVNGSTWKKDLETHYFELRKEFYEDLKAKLEQSEDVILDYPSLWYGFISEHKEIHNDLDHYEKEQLEKLINLHHSIKTRQPNCFVLQTQKYEKNGLMKKRIFFRLPEACPNEERKLIKAHFEIELEQLRKALI